MSLVYSFNNSNEARRKLFRTEETCQTNMVKQNC